MQTFIGKNIFFWNLLESEIFRRKIDMLFIPVRKQLLQPAAISKANKKAWKEPQNVLLIF